MTTDVVRYLPSSIEVIVNLENGTSVKKGEVKSFSSDNDVLNRNMGQRQTILFGSGADEVFLMGQPFRKMEDQAYFDQRDGCAVRRLRYSYSGLLKLEVGGQNG